MSEQPNMISAILGVTPGSDLARTIDGRADIMALTDRTHDAALTPAEPGGLSHGLRAALACRMARLNGDADFAAHYAALVEKAGGADAELADPELAPGTTGGDDPALAAMVAHVDLVTRTPRDAGGQDIARLQGAGISDADIVRLSELIAFVSYQLRVAAGLRLMQGMA